MDLLGLQNSTGRYVLTVSCNVRYVPIVVLVVNIIIPVYLAATLINVSVDPISKQVLTWSLYPTRCVSTKSVKQCQCT